MTDVTKRPTKAERQRAAALLLAQRARLVAALIENEWGETDHPWMRSAKLLESGVIEVMREFDPKDGEL